MATRVGFFIIHNSNHKLVHSVDVPWDFGTNAEDGTVIQPNPLPPAVEEPIEGFTWNDIQMERMILHIQRKLHRRKYRHRRRPRPFILQEAVFILSPSLAEKLGVVTIENEDLKEGIYLKRYSDLKTEIYLTSEELESEYEMIVRLPNDITKIILFNENNLPNFEDTPDLPEEPDEGETDPDNPDEGENPDEPEPPEEINPEEPPIEVEPEIEYILNEDIIKNIIESIPSTNKFSIYTNFNAAISSNILLTEESARDGDNIEILPELPLVFDYIGNRIVITENSLSNGNIWITPTVEKPIQVIFTNNSIEVEEIPEEETPSNEDLFINWFIRYFNKVLLKDDKFLNHFNNNRTYVVITQENKNIMGLMTLYKGRSVLNFKNHNYAELIDNRFPDIRDDMIIKDESFGGHDEDKDYSVNKEETSGTIKPGHFGGHGDDIGFLI